MKRLSTNLFSLLISLLMVYNLTAQDSGKLLKTVDKDLRQAERDMFSGKTEKAVASLENIRKMLNQVKTDDPNNPKLKTAENKYNKLVKDLERRTGKRLGGGTLTSQESDTDTRSAAKPLEQDPSEQKPAPTGTSKKPSDTPADVPYAARKPLNTAKRLLTSLDGNLNNLNDPAYTGNKDQLVKNIEDKMVQIRESLNEAKNLAATKGVNSHPDFDAIEIQLSDADKSVAAAKSGYADQKASAAASAKEVDKDVAELKTEYDKAMPVFEQATGYVFSYNDLKTVQDVIVQIENFEQNNLPAIKLKMQTFANKYGSTKNEIDQKADAMGFSNNYYRASYPYIELENGIENINKTRDVMAEDLVRRTNAELEGIRQGGADFQILERYQKVQDWVKMAVRYQPDNPKVKELQSTIDSQIADGMKAFHTRIDGRKWEGHASNAPENAKELAQTALEWFKNSPDWGKRSSKIRQPLAVVVTGPWSVQKRNLLGNPIMYGLPVKLAVKVDEDKELNVARVYELTMRTIESANAKMQPPFDHITVGNSYFIRPEKVN